DETQLPELVDGMVMLALTVTLPDNKRSTLLARVAWANKFDNDSGGRYFIGVDFVSGDGIDALYKAAKSFSV
ncbi:MAG: hypothetical protein L6Q71_10305, partial [Planctomycetes bacterium]|nr:hypothetical protein [Planctomycetota bacterium]